MLHHVRTADGFYSYALALAQAYAQAIAADESAAIVGDQVGDFGGVEAAVCLANKAFQLAPEFLSFAHLPQA